LLKNKKEDLNKTAIKSGTGYMMANILIRSSAIITAPIFTRILTTSDYGIASNFTAWLNIFLIFTGLALPYSIGVAKIDFPTELNKFLASIQTLGGITAISFLGFAIVFKEQLAVWMSLDEDLVIVMFVYLLVLPSLVFSQERYKFELLYKQNIYIAIFNSLGAIAFCLIFILYVFDDQRYYGRIIGLIFPMFLMGFYFYFKIIKNGWSKNIKKYWAYALKISIPMIPHALAMVVLNQIDRVMIINYSGSSDAGLYSFGFAYAILLMIFSNAVLQAYKPWLYISYQKNDIDAIKKSNKMITLSVCVITLVIITMGPEVLSILGTEEFLEAKWVVMPIALSALFQYIYNTYSSLELYHKKTTIIAIGSVFTAIINYFLNSTFIPMYGYAAAAYTTFVSYFILAMFHLFAHRKICKKAVFNDKFIWLSAMITVIIGFIISELYAYFFMRYLFLIIILLIIGIAKKAEVFNAYKLVAQHFNKK
jgi:O-antigen/teichoic acid export membrane protein